MTSIYIEGTLHKGQATFFFFSISSPFREMYQKYHLSHFACLGYILCNFGGYRYGIKVTLHNRQSEFSSVFRFVFKNLSRNIKHQNSHKRSISDIHGCNQSITKGTLLGEQSLNLHIHMTNFPQTVRLTHLTHVLQTK